MKVVEIVLLLLEVRAVFNFRIAPLTRVRFQECTRCITTKLQNQRNNSVCESNGQELKKSTTNPHTFHSNTRRNVIMKTMILPWLISSSSATIAHAAIPTMDDYYATSTGAQLKNKSTSSSSEEKLKDVLSQKIRNPISDTSSLTSYVDQLMTSVDALDALVDKADFSSLRSVLRGDTGTIYEKNVLSIARKKNFGIAEKEFTKVFGTANAKKIEEGRRDISVSLAELEDYALSNRAIFFNSVDRKQIDELIAESGFKEDMSEGKELWKSASNSVKEFKKDVLSVII